MVQRRSYSLIVRAMLVALGIFLMWRIIALLTIVPNSDKNPLIENIPEKHISLKEMEIGANTAHGESSNRNTQEVITVKVYYESMCPDSKYFIIHQLLPTIKQLPEIVDFKLIPYGKAKTFENATGIYFTCQHLRLECEGNKIHACAVKHIKDEQKLLNFVSCLFKNMRNPPKSAQSCASEAGADWNTIQQCASSKEGSELLKLHGEDTHSLSPSVTFIPTIVLNDNQGIQKNILKDLKKEVCNLYFANTGLKLESCL